MRQPASLVVVGDGPDRERVHALAAGLPRVHLTGFVEHTAVPAVLASLDVLVLPSAYEEMGSVLVEAMVAGLPVVASDVGGIPEVVRDGETRSEEHTSELQSRQYLVCRLLLEKKK